MNTHDVKKGRSHFGTVLDDVCEVMMIGVSPIRSNVQVSVKETTTVWSNEHANHQFMKLTTLPINNSGLDTKAFHIILSQ